jgi:maltooligosyltrehalose trehalohydrolase
MHAGGDGCYELLLDNVWPGARYFFRLDGDREFPDPASRLQPSGVFGPSELIASEFPWTDDAWRGISLSDYIIYELHTGLFSPEGTFEAAIPFLNGLKALGATAIELMPVAQFSGERNWGYDGVYPFAVQNSYGGPAGLRRLVDACHARGLAVVLDVVYNHLGPEGNFLAQYGPYFTPQYRTPWGAAINFDGEHSEGVRRFFIENALYWLQGCHVDALRLDAVHAIFDFSAETFLEQLSDAVHGSAEQGKRPLYLICECNRNDVREIRPRELGGYGLDAHWNDDFHHALHALLTGEKAGYYRDFGKFTHMVKAFREGYVYTGQHSEFRRRRHGVSSKAVAASKFVVFAQNHDQVGNRMRGERSSLLVSREALKLAAGVVLLSPYVPLIFMGEEYGETAPFQYFTSHSDAGLIEAVRRGRREEFAAFRWQGEVPDPQAESAFLNCKLNRALMGGAEHRVLYEYYQELIRLRKTLVRLGLLTKETMRVEGLEDLRILIVVYYNETSAAAAALNFGDEPASVAAKAPPGRWRLALDSSESRWGGPGAPAPHESICDGQLPLVVNPKALLHLLLTE